MNEAPTLTPEQRKQVLDHQAETEATLRSLNTAESLEKAIQDTQAKNLRESMGLDLPFDPKAFILTGSIVRKGLEVLPKVFVDMKTLTARERMVAEAIVQEDLKNLPMDQVYFNAIELAMLALSILRINSAEFPIPVLGATEEQNAGLYRAKVELYKTLSASSSDFVKGLSRLYTSLERISLPDEEVQKKS